MRLLIISMILFVYSAGFAQTHDRDIEYDRIVESRVSIESEYYEFTDDERERLQYLRVIDQPFSDVQITGLELLGKYAETTEKRDEYARRYVATYSDNVVRSNVWALTVARISREQDLVAAARDSSPELVRELNELGFPFPDADVGKTIFDKRKEERDSLPSSGMGLGRSSRVVNYFVSLDCGQKCDDEFRPLHSRSASGAIGELNVVFVGSGDDDSAGVFDWARSNSISRAELENRHIQLHVDSEYWKEQRESNEVPQTN